ncbi:Uncharacterised protein [Mycobacteroides abscessus]|nr:Uncharacterised protein [Mycobacteroides abscessus]
MQRPHRGPPPGPVVHRPRRQPLGFGALAAAQDLGRTAHQPQRQRGPLHNALIHPRTFGQGGIRRPAMPARAAFGEPGPRISDLEHILPRDPVIGHQVPNSLVPQVIRHRHLNPGPALRTRPHRHVLVGALSHPEGQPHNPPRRGHRRQRRHIQLQLPTRVRSTHMRTRGHGRNTGSAARESRASALLVHIGRATARPIRGGTAQTWPWTALTPNRYRHVELSRCVSY